MIYSFFIWISALLNLYTFGFESNNKSIQNTSPNYVLVELFTSEGCSSCPPAETLIHELQKQYVDKPVIFLEYHVDYWNYLGWLDSFSSEKNTLRQQQYASWFNISDIYTPQAIINGTFQMVGSNKSQLQSTINQQLVKVQNKTLNFSFNKTQDIITIHLEQNIEKNNQQIFYGVLMMKSISSRITKGENKGLTMIHNNVVIAYKDFDNTNNLQFKIPSNWAHKQFSIVCFVQNKSNGQIETLSIKDI